jgi:hypothetical protein
MVVSERVSNWGHEMGFPWTEQQAFVDPTEMTLVMGRVWGIHDEMVT